MLTAAQVADFARDGYVLGGQVLGEAEVEELRAELARVIAGHGGADPQPVLLRNLAGRPEAPVWQVVNIWEASAAYARLVHHPVLAAEVQQLTGARELRLWHDQIQYKPAETGGVNRWHQDSPLWPNLWPHVQVSAWVALDEVDETNGCMSMVPGSHRWGPAMPFLEEVADYARLPERYGEHTVTRVLRPVRRGCVHYHHGLTWHGSHANRSGRPRRAIALHFMPEETVFVEANGHPMRPFMEHLAPGDTIAGAHFPQVWPRPA